MSVELLIRGGNILDGTGGSAFVADVAVDGGRIVAVGQLHDVPCGRIVDATGLAVAPGFIDIHSHSDYTLLVDPRAVSAITQGVTLEVVGNCGFGCAPIVNPATAAASIYGFNNQIRLDWNRLGQYLDRLEQSCPAVNVMTLVPNGQLRRSVLGVVDRAATASELARMGALLQEGLDDGAFGYSTGLEYPAERGAPDSELLALCRIAARAGGLYACHTRRRDTGAVSAIDEAIRVGERAGIRTQISHILPRKTSDGESRAALDLIDGARQRGVDVGFDMHTRLFGTTFLNTIIPPWALGDASIHLASVEGRRRMRDFDSIVASGGWDRVVLLDHPEFPDYARRSIGEAAREEGRDGFDLAFDILQADCRTPESGRSPSMVIIRAYTPDQQAEVFGHPMCVPGSDATSLAPDGPLAGSAFHGAYSWACWYFDFMVRQRQLLSAAEAVHRLTQMPARTLGLTDRGSIAVGCRADIAIFDANQFASNATTFEPNRLASGMRHVWVNGVETLRDGVLTGQRGGQVIRKVH